MQRIRRLDDDRNIDDYFLTRAYNMVDIPMFDSIASWSQNGKSFIIWKLFEFNRHVLYTAEQYIALLPFVLSGYGFERVGSAEMYEYANDNFLRGQPQLMKNIPRPDLFITRASMINQIGRLAKEKDELLIELRKQELQVKELKYHLQHIGICKL
ncbi:Heat stress transcription factor A-4a [Cardamine amara subsp. amara]|uniref:Heat stress transcription factor A-4a n=1 Tax=Cardamine amara subsp. amara TaxID=228776 RepID=A0ABD1C5L7_CARAN